jgi:quinoprotein glucose dehydrogenase
MIKPFFRLIFLSLIPGICWAQQSKIQDFSGQISDSRFSKKGKIATHPLVEYMTSFGIGSSGELYIVESPRQKHGQILDIRGARQFTQQDFKNKSLEERVQMMESDPKTGKAYFTRHSERIAKIIDTNGDGVYDKRTSFADGMMGNTADGVAFSAIEHDGSVYLTCIPNLWKFTDTTGDGIADKSEILLTGFGVKLSMFGHDMHGITVGPDGRLYWSIGDRGYKVQSKEGEIFSAPSRGAIFRCELDGSNFEVFHHGLRNPQEIAFDDHGNIFTFDNTGDIGDQARAVYAVESGDSGWYMEHQGLHQYRSSLDHSEFDGKSPWIEDEMFKPQSPKHPQWHLPPLSNFHSGPSGITHLTGEAVPNEWRNSFLVSNFRASTARSNILRFKFDESGASFKTVYDQPVVTKLVASDVNFGYDGKIYIADFGGGWSVNNRGSIQFIEYPEGTAQPSVKETQKLFKQGFDKVTNPEKLLSHPDKRVRQYAQFELVKRAKIKLLKEALQNGKTSLERLHGLWGLAQLQRSNKSQTVEFIADFANDSDPIIRQNVCRSLGDFQASQNNELILIKALSDSSSRVQLKATIALGKTAQSSQAKKALWKLIEENNGAEHILRHVAIKALARLNDAAGAKAQVNSTSTELRLGAVLVLRDLNDSALASFVKDSNKKVREEAIRAIYDKHIIDAMPAITAESANILTYPLAIQRRILFANLWLGTESNALNIIKIAETSQIDGKLKEHAIKALLRWGKAPENDPVFSTYRPTKTRSNKLGQSAQKALITLLQKADGNTLTLALELAQKIKVELPANTLMAQITNEKAPSNIRISAINTLIKQDESYLDQLAAFYFKAKDEQVVARLFELQLMKSNDKNSLIAKTEKTKNLYLLRALFTELSSKPSLHDKLASLWNERNSFPHEVQLDLYKALNSNKSPKSITALEPYASNPDKAYEFTFHGGDEKKGKVIFEGQGACLQCHKVNRKGGMQGPELDDVASHLNSKELMESLIYPNKLIAEGFGTFIVTDKKGNITAGVLKKENANFYEIKTANKTVKIKKTDVASKQGPSSGMPPIARALKLDEVRDLVAYLETLKDKKKKKKSGH